MGKTHRKYMISCDVLEIVQFSQKWNVVSGNA